MGRKIFFILIVTMIFGTISFSCSKKDSGKIDVSFSQEDIDLIIKHKKNIDKITGKYDLELQKTKKENQQIVLSEGKDKINKYLESSGLNPVVFMRRSKRILKGYLAFHETSEESLEKKMKLLENENLTENEYKTRKEFYRQANESLFKELTSDLSDYEIQLIKSNLKNLLEIVK